MARAQGIFLVLDICDIEEIVDITDHNQGENPYYQPAKK